MHEVGGNFGTRGSFNPEFALVTWAARHVGRPVKWTCERQEAFLCDYQARDLAVEAELALDRDGNFIAMRGSNIANSGAYPISYGPLAKGVEIMSSIYHVPAVHFRARAAITNTLPTRPYRSSGRPEVMFVMERLIDLAARQCGFDRLELRRRNLVPEAAMPYRNPLGMVYDSGSYHKVMERVLADWTGFPPGGRKLGNAANIVALASAITSTLRPAHRASAPVTVLPDKVVEVVVGTVSNGQGHETSFAQLSANGSAYRSTVFGSSPGYRRVRSAAARIPAARCAWPASSC
jgi:carbon-monoxide dehydrogenase large subunit